MKVKGLRAETIDLNALAFLGKENGIYKAQVDILYFKEFEFCETLSFMQVKGKWILIGRTKVD